MLAEKKQGIGIWQYEIGFQFPIPDFQFPMRKQLVDAVNVGWLIDPPAMWHAVGSSPLNRFFITIVTFGNSEPVRVRQGRQIAISTVPTLMPRPPCRRSSATLRLCYDCKLPVAP